MNRRWELNGRLLAFMRARVGLSEHDVAVRLGVDDRDVVGVEKGYRRFETEAQAKSFVARFEEACRDAQRLVKPEGLVAP